MQIFTLAQGIEHCGLCLEEPWRLRKRRTCTCKLPLAYVVAGVCVRWRAAALDTSRLWSSVHITSTETHPRPRGYGQPFPHLLRSKKDGAPRPYCLGDHLQRSGSQPLDVEVSISGDMQELESETVRALELLHDRLRRLSILVAHPAVAMCLLASFRRPHTPLPLLESLTIHIPFTDEHRFPPELRRELPHNFFLRGAPRLRELYLLGIPSPDILKMPLPLLSELYLEPLSGGWDLRDLRNIGQHSPQLTVLFLYCHNALGTTGGSAIEFPSLRTLRLAPLANSLPLLRVLSAPNVEILQLEGIPHDDLDPTRSLVDILSHITPLQAAGPSHIACKFPRVRSLRLGVDTEVFNYRLAGTLIPLFRLFPQTTHLALRQSLPTTFAIMLLMTMDREILLPMLKQIAVFGGGDPRCAAAYPIRVFATYAEIFTRRQTVGAPLTTFAYPGESWLASDIPGGVFRILARLEDSKLMMAQAGVTLTRVDLLPDTRANTHWIQSRWEHRVTEGLSL